MGPLETEHNERLRDHNAKYAGKTLIGEEIWRITIALHADEIRRIWAHLDRREAERQNDTILDDGESYTASAALKVAVEALTAIRDDAAYKRFDDGHDELVESDPEKLQDWARNALDRLRGMGVQTP